MTQDVIGAIRRLADLQGRAFDPHPPHRLPIVAFAGGTGSGKSSLVNAVSGRSASMVGELRPTTSEAVAVFPEGAGTAAPELDRLGVIRRVEGAHRGAVLLDLPDLDSVVSGHRRLAEAVLEHADAIVWVVDPEKYADAVLHATLERFADVPSVVACNHADRLVGHERLEVLGDLGRLVGDLDVFPTAVPPGGEPVGVEVLGAWVAAVDPAPLDRPTRQLALRLVDEAGPPLHPPAADAWAAVEEEVGGFVAACAERAADRLVTTGRKHALFGTPSHPVPPVDPPQAPPVPADWPTGWTAIDAVASGWGPAAARLVDAADAAALMADSAVVHAPRWWTWARWGVPAVLVAGAVPTLFGVWWPLPVAVVVAVVLAVVLGVSGRAAGRLAAERVRGEVDVQWSSALDSDGVAGHRRRCRRLEEMAAAAAAVDALVPRELGRSPSA